MPSSMEPQHPYEHAGIRTPLSHVVADQQALSWPAREPWRRDADEAGPWRLPTSCSTSAVLLDLSSCTMDDLQEVLHQPRRQLGHRMKELRGVVQRNRRTSIKDWWRGMLPELQLRWAAIQVGINVVTYAGSSRFSSILWKAALPLVTPMGFTFHWRGPSGVLMSVHAQD